MECKSKRMKEEAPSKKLPPKMYGGEFAASASTPTKAAHDEILSSLLRINNFDSISSIKDESLDIDLSACVTISSASFVNGNSLSSTDFWRVLDESAQNNTELNLSADVSRDDLHASEFTTPNLSSSSGSGNETHSEFNVTFLRPEPPNAFTNSPFKKTNTPVKLQSPEQMHLLPQSLQRKAKLPTSTSVRLKVFKEEPLDEKYIPQPKTNIVTKVEPCESETMPPTFTIFQQPKPVSIQPITSDLLSMPPPDSLECNGKVIDAPLYKCLDCNGLVLDNQQLLSTHEAASHRLRVTYKCNECQREFEMLAGLKKHLKTHRTEGRKDTWKKCPDCGKCLKLGSMWMHRKIHSDNKKYQCDICGQKFVQKINLTHHARIHSSEKPYECPECQKRFQERSHLQRHQKYHAQTRSYRCEKCGKMYKTERCLKVHNLVHLEQRPFACNVCDKSFISNSKLKQHSNIHTGMRPFKCNYCPRDFTNFPNWLKHTRRRHKVDHKTGEHLENIPSYCSKKSTTTKAQKAAAAAAAAAAASATVATEEQSTNGLVIVNTSTAEGAVTVAAAVPGKKSGTEPVNAMDSTATSTPVKQARKKKQPQQAALAAMGISLPPGTALQQVHPQLPSTPQLQNSAAKKTMSNSNSSDVLTTVLLPLLPPPSKQPKAKRERKQLAPKQLQQKPVAVPVATQIKKEPLSEPSESLTHGPFLDLHGLSLTSAEELIMEQALEMEECGLYDAPVTSTDIGTSDNAISSETAAAIHFQIKNEIPDELLPDEEYYKPAESNRLTCPSLESSPFSSPASIELAAVSSHNATNQQNGSSRVSNYYLPAFTLNAQGAIIAGANKLVACTTTATSTTTATNTVSVVNLPLIGRSNQMLPSVDTLLFTTQTGNRFFNGKVTTASHNLT